MNDILYHNLLNANITILKKITRIYMGKQANRAMRKTLVLPKISKKTSYELIDYYDIIS